jgi:undecaprenyl diphosphate synthase
MKKKILPQHVAFIMDGNRRWARAHGLPAFEGHRRGLQRTQEMIDECLKMRIPYCTVWAFSTENWKRSSTEVNFLMKLFREYLNHHLTSLYQKGVRIVHLGRKDHLPKSIVQLLQEAEKITQKNRRLVLQLAIDYGGRDELLRAIQKAKDEHIEVTEENLGSLLDTAGAPDPDLVIRTSGEQRLSGFMLWQAAYSELYFTDKGFPDFTAAEFKLALKEFADRNRNFGA